MEFQQAYPQSNDAPSNIFCVTRLCGDNFRADDVRDFDGDQMNPFGTG